MQQIPRFKKDLKTNLNEGGQNGRRREEPRRLIYFDRRELILVKTFLKLLMNANRPELWLSVMRTKPSHAACLASRGLLAHSTGGGDWRS